MIRRPRLLVLLALLALGIAAFLPARNAGPAHAAEETLTLATLLAFASPVERASDDPCHKRGQCGTQTQSPGMLALDDDRLGRPRAISTAFSTSPRHPAGISPVPEPSPPKIAAAP